MNEITQLHGRACERFAGHVRVVRQEQWDAPTPCPDWNVRDLVNHVVAEDLWVEPLLAGATLDEVGDRFAGDVLGADPAGAYDRAAAAAVAAFREPGALNRTVHLSFGETPGAEYAWQLFADHLIHGWDLARAIGADDRLDPDQVNACAEWFAPREELFRAAGAIGPHPELPPEADPQARLLAAYGRSTLRPAIGRAAR